MKLRRVYLDASAFIPVPTPLQHRKVAVIFWPLAEKTASEIKPAATWLVFLSNSVVRSTMQRPVRGMNYMWNKINLKGATP